MKSPQRRERDPKRVPSLGISDPISHVFVLDNDSDTEIDWANHNDSKRKITDFIASGGNARGGAKMMELENKNSGKKPNVIKIDSNPHEDVSDAEIKDDGKSLPKKKRRLR